MPLGGACSAESNTVRHAIEKRAMHSRRDVFLMAITHGQCGLTKRDLSSNINFLMKMPVAPEGKLPVAETPGAARVSCHRLPVVVLHCELWHG